MRLGFVDVAAGNTDFFVPKRQICKSNKYYNGIIEYHNLHTKIIFICPNY